MVNIENNIRIELLITLKNSLNFICLPNSNKYNVFKRRNMPCIFECTFDVCNTNDCHVN